MRGALAKKKKLQIMPIENEIVDEAIEVQRPNVVVVGTWVRPSLKSNTMLHLDRKPGQGDEDPLVRGRRRNDKTNCSSRLRKV